MDKYIDQLSQLMDKSFLQYKLKFNDKIGVLVSGGIDSSIIAYYCKKHFPKQTILFSFGSATSKDKPYVYILQKHLQLPINYLTITQESVNAVIPTVKQLLKELLILNSKVLILDSITHTSLAVGYYLIFQEIFKHQISTVFTGQGPDVLMAGYHKYNKFFGMKNYELRIKNEIKKDINHALQIDQLRDTTMASYYKIKLINPYLEKRFISLSLKISSKYKLVNSQKSIFNNQPFNSLTRKHFNYFIEKYIERLWGKNLGLPDKIVWRPKMAFQYSTQVQKLVEKFVYN